MPLSSIQAHRPARHTIVEAHPDVVDHMTRTGWSARPGVRVLRGRWQDVLPELLAEAPYDGIFFDTYGKRCTDSTVVRIGWRRQAGQADGAAWG